jgi:nucleoside-diphosphate-sugar epimerase
MVTKQPRPAESRILVTGSNGFLGAKVVEKLLASGRSNLRCFVRTSSRLSRLEAVLAKAEAADLVEIYRGDLTSKADCREAAYGVDLVYHLAAGFDKSFAGAFMNSALATRNLVDALRTTGKLKRLVNVSSFAVYSNLRLRPGAVLDESCPLESSSQERFDAYGFGKLKQEEIIKDAGQHHGLPYVILRPGMIYGPGKRELSGRVGIGTFGLFIQVNGSNLLPLTFVDNCAEAIVQAGTVPGIEGEVFNVVDDELLTGREFYRAYRKRTGQKFAVRIPYSVAAICCRLWEGYSRRSHNQLPPAFNRRRCAADWKNQRFSNSKLKNRVGWQPQVGLRQAMDLFLDQYSSFRR